MALPINATYCKKMKKLLQGEQLGRKIVLKQLALA